MTATVRTRAWPAGTTRRGLVLLDLASVASLVMLQSLALRAGVAPEASWRPALAGTALVWAAAVCGYLLPARRRTRPVPGPLGPLLAELSTAAGVTRPPQFVMDAWALGSGAVTVGRRGRYRIVLDAGLVHRADIRRLTAVVLHELAHVRNGDVELARFAVALWRVVSVSVLLPYAAVALWARTPRDVWLAGGTWALLYLLYAEVLRRRELYADRDAVAWGADPGQWAVPAAAPWWRRLRGPSLLRTHPTPAARRRALAEPQSWAASSMVAPILGVLLSFVGFAMIVALFERPELRPGGPGEWPPWLSALVWYGSAVVAVAALLTLPSERFGEPGVRHVPLAVRHRRSASIRITAIFGLVASLLFGFDSAHLVAGDRPEHVLLPPLRIVAPPRWETPRSAELSGRVRIWLAAGGGPSALELMTRDRQALRDRIRSTPARRIDWAAFGGDCAALGRDAAALDARGAFPIAAGESARVALRDELRAAASTLCGSRRRTPREFGALEDAGAHLARADEAYWNLQWAQLYYLFPG